MSTITNINAGDTITSSRTVINTNAQNLNTDKIETSVLDTDTTLAANSDAKIPSQKAVKAYVDALAALTTQVASKSDVSAGPASSSTQTITHTLGKTPIVIRIYGYGYTSTGNSASTSTGTYNATGNRCVYVTGGTGIKAATTSTTYAVRLAYSNSGADAQTATGVIQNITSTTFDIVWTASASLASAYFLWEAN